MNDEIMTVEQYDEMRGNLPLADRQRLDELADLMTRVLGSHEAFRLWLNLTTLGYQPTPAGAIRAGRVAVVLDAQSAHHGPGYNPA